MLYTPVKLSVAADQLEKLKRDIGSMKKKNLSIKIQLKNKHGQPMPEQHTLLLTRGQLASINKVRANGHRRFKVIRMSRQQVEKISLIQVEYLASLLVSLHVHYLL